MRVHDVAATRDALARRARSWERGEPWTSDEITLTGLRVFGRHGVYDDERRDGPGLRRRLHAARLDTAPRRRDRRRRRHRALRRGRRAGRRDRRRRARRSASRRSPRRIADALLADDRVRAGVRVTVHKPYAPIPLPFADVVGDGRARAGPADEPPPGRGLRRRDVDRRPRAASTPSSRSARTSATARATLAAAVDDLARLPLVDAVRVSEPIESVAVKPDGPDAAAPAYLNAVALVTTRLAPSVLLALPARDRGRGTAGERPRALGRPHPRPRPHRVRRRAQRRPAAHAAAPARGRARLRARAVARRSIPTPSCRARAGSTSCSSDCGGGRVKRTGAGILLVAARARRRRGIPRSTSCSPSTGRPTFVPAVTPADPARAARRHRRRARAARSGGRPAAPQRPPVNPFRALRDRDAREGVEHRRRRRRAASRVGLLLFLLTRPVDAAR